MSEEDSPEAQLATYKEQLGQIEESLSQDPKNGALLRLKAELLDVIKLTQDLLKLKSSSSSSSSPTSSSSSSRSSSSSSSSRSSSNGTSTSSSKSSSSSKGGSTTNIGSTNRSKSLILQQQYALTNDNDQAQESAVQLDTSSTFTAGTKCLAKFSEDGTWYEAVIESVPTNDQDKFFVTYTEYGNQEYVTLDNLKVIQGEGKKRKDKPTESEDGLIPKSLKILPTDSEEVRQAKRRRQHAIKSQTRNKKLEEERSGKKSAWQEFTQKSGSKQKASSGPKRESIFRSPDTVEGKVGVTGSGKPLTPSPQFNSTEVAHVKHKLPPPT